jgi:CBS domain-containing protein
MERAKTAGDYMTPDVIVLRPEMDLQRAMRVLLKSSISGAPVVDTDGKVIGLLTEKDCFRVAFEASYHREPCGPVSEYMSTAVETIDAETSVIDVLDLFLRSRYRRFPVVSGNRLVGIISRRDALRAVVETW